MLSSLLAFSFLPLLTSPTPQEPMPLILSLREQAEVRTRWLEERLETVVPELMRREGIDMWILIAREYNEDPVVKTMLPPTWLGARRRTILVFHDLGADSDGGRVDRFAVARYAVADLFRGAWEKEEEPDQLRYLARVIEQRNPRRIAINVSPTFALADGLSASERDGFLAALPAEYHERLVPGERLAIGWLETRTESELEVYPTICAIAHRIIAEGLSEQVVQPGVTTTADVQWWYRERIRGLGLETWFHPSVSLQRPEGAERSGSFSKKEGSKVIRRGDLIHIDFGITYLALNTDTQQHAYVLRAGETEAPEGLRRGLAISNRLQDILTSNFVTGRTGNEILAASLETARAEGIEATIYTHPLGLHGHGAGPTIGLWDMQDGVPGRGDYPLFPMTVHSIELNAAVEIPEWDNKKVRVMLEEDAVFDGERVRYLDGRQTELILIR